jgi:hypothetical protein
MENLESFNGSYPSTFSANSTTFDLFSILLFLELIVVAV